MELKGKKMNVIGDSITQGVGVKDKKNTFVNRLYVNEGFEIVRNYGISGTRFARQKSASGEPTFDRDFCSRVEELDIDADIVVVFGGTNDFGHGDAAFGTMSDRTEETFYGAMHVLCQKLYERYPEAQLVFMTPTHRCSEDDKDWNERGIRRVGVLADYVNAIRQVTEYHSIPVLDLWKVSGIQPKVPVLKEKYMPDGLHPNDAGHVLIANKLIGFLNTL